MKRIVAIVLTSVLFLNSCGITNTATKNDLSDTITETESHSKNCVKDDDTTKTKDLKQIETIDESSNSTEIKDRTETNNEDEQVITTIVDGPIPDYQNLDDENLERYLQDKIYQELVSELNDSGYCVENISAIYISKEYIEELTYNSKENIFFGYSLSELDEAFVETKYMFTLGNDGETVVTEVEAFDDTYEKVLKNVAIGAGVILICITVSAVTAGAGAPAISLIFAASAKTGAIAAVSGGAIGGIAAGTIEGIKTKDFDKAMKAAALAGSEGFKWGAIGGAISGGVSEFVALKGTTLTNNLTMNEVASIQMDSGYPLDVIREFDTIDQYYACKKVGLEPAMIDGKTALVRNIDLKQVDEFGNTNLQRMAMGDAPLDADGIAYELHHLGQNTDSTLAILTKAEHRLGDSFKMWHDTESLAPGVHSQLGGLWDVQRQAFWKAFAQAITGV